MAKPPEPNQDEMKFGDVCKGWTQSAWIQELRRKADCCADSHPETADLYRRWADDIERKKHERSK